MFKYTYKKLLHACCAIVVAVSAIDTYWLSKARAYIQEVEQNPLGQYLISLDGGDVSLFILCKFLGTYVAVAAIYCMNINRPNSELFVAASLAIAQLFLLAYLYYGLAFNF